MMFYKEYEAFHVIATILATSIFLLFAVTLFTFIKRNKICRILASIAAIGGYLSSLAMRKLILPEILVLAELNIAVLFGLPMVLVFLYTLMTAADE